MKIMFHGFKAQTLRDIIDRESGFHTPIRYTVADGYENNNSDNLELLLILFPYNTDASVIKQAYGIENFRNFGEVVLVPHQNRYEMRKPNTPERISILKNKEFCSHNLESCLSDTLHNGDTLALVPDVATYYPHNLHDYIELQRNLLHKRVVGTILDVDHKPNKNLPHIEAARIRATGRFS